MPLVSTRALVLQAFPYSDTSKILRLLAPELGVRSVIAKGARRPRSRFGGLLEPFTEGEAQFLLREGRDLHTLSAFDLLRSRQSLGRDLTAFAAASLMAELALRFGTEEPNPELFQAISASLDALARGADGRVAYRCLAGVWQLVALLGYEPHLDACLRCGRIPEPDEPTRFDVDAGGIVCTRCRTHGRMVDALSRVQVGTMLLVGEPGPEALDLPLHRALLRAFLVAHLASEPPLRALDLFLQQLR
jgi:DNA repair protein RecO (recombination protein O)